MKKILLILLVCFSLPNTADANWDSKWAYRSGFYYTVGATGIKARYHGVSPDRMSVTSVDDNSPASGLIEVGDVIYGVNGNNFTTTADSGDKWDMEHPLVEIGEAVIASHRNLNSVITFKIQRKTQFLSVPIQMNADHASYWTAPDFPTTDSSRQALIESCAEYVADTFHKKDHTTYFKSTSRSFMYYGFALLATGDNKYRRELTMMANEFAARSTNADLVGPDDKTSTWIVLGETIFLAEFYLRYKEEWVLDALKDNQKWLIYAQTSHEDAIQPQNPDYGVEWWFGGYGHRTNMSGYGTMAFPTIEAVIALSLMDRCGIKTDKKIYDDCYTYLDSYTTPLGSVWYGGPVSPTAEAQRYFNNPDEHQNQSKAQPAAIAAYLYPYTDSYRASMVGLHTSDFLRNNNKATVFACHGLSNLHGWVFMGAARDMNVYDEVMNFWKHRFAVTFTHDGHFDIQPGWNGKNFDLTPQIPTASYLMALCANRKTMHMTGKGGGIGEDPQLNWDQVPPNVTGMHRRQAFDTKDGAEFDFTPTATDYYGATLNQFTIENKPTWAVFDGTTGRLYGIPTSADHGEHDDITIRVSNGVTEGAMVFGLLVQNSDNPINAAPRITTPPNDIEYRLIGGFTGVTINASDPEDDDSIQWEPYTLTVPGWSRMVNGYSPKIKGYAHRLGNYPQVWTISDGWNTEEFSFEVRIVDRLPGAPTISGTIEVHEVNWGSVWEFTPTVSIPDIDPRFGFVFSIENKPTWAAFDTSTGRLYGQPGPDDVGNDWFRITVSNGVHSKTTQWNANIVDNEPNTLPPPPAVTLLGNMKFTIPQNAVIGDFVGKIEAVGGTNITYFEAPSSVVNVYYIGLHNGNIHVQGNRYQFAVGTLLQYTLIAENEEGGYAVGYVAITIGEPTVAPVTPGLHYGTVSGNINTTDANPMTSITVDLHETEDAIGYKTTEIYTGEIYDADGNISFTERTDDKTRLYIDGVLVLSDDRWNYQQTTSNLKLTPGWHKFELRISNGGGGSGPVKGSLGFGYDPDGGTNWVHPEDAGDGSLFKLAE